MSIGPEIPAFFWCAIAAAAWLALAFIAPKLLNNPRESVEAGLVYQFMRLYTRGMHRLTVLGAENIPRARRPGPLIIVANHTAGVDPILLQAAVPFEIRFMMARDMQHRALDPLWRWVGVIGVDRDAKSGDMRAARDAIRYLTAAGQPLPDGAISSGVIGIFPEGAIERPPRQLRPFLPGIGLLVHRTRARVLPVVISGTPVARAAWGSLLVRSRSTIEFLPSLDYATMNVTPAAIAADLHARFTAHTGWPAAT